MSSAADDESVDFHADTGYDERAVNCETKTSAGSEMTDGTDGWQEVEVAIVFDAARNGEGQWVIWRWARLVCRVKALAEPQR